MSLRVIGYSNGRRITVEEGPARARVSKYGQGNTHDLTLVGSFVQGDSEAERARQVQRAFKARHRA